VATRTDLTQPIVAGLVTGIVGFGSSFAVVIAGLHAVGADAAQTSSGLFFLCLSMGAGCVLFGALYRRPITMAWSTPGAALLASAGRPDGGFAAAIGAFVLTGVLLALTGLIPQVATAIQRIPAVVASAMLAGILLELCLEPFSDFRQAPWAIGCMLLAWVLGQRFLPRWAVPLTLVVAVVAIAVSGAFGRLHLPDGALPHVTLTAPHWSPAAATSLAIPLYLVTMTSQNIPGVTVMRGLGYEVPWRSSLMYTGGLTAVGGPFGAHAINLSAIAAALAAGPEAGPDRSRRWVAAVATGSTYIVLGCASPLVVAAANVAPAGIVPAFAGIALFAPLSGALTQALARPDAALPAVVTVCAAASGLTLGGIGAPFWALLAGCATYAITRKPRSSR
jgi:benzoate membrane transport protein